MENQHSFLKRIIEKLTKAGIPYMLSGSIGSSFHGKPRSTHDIDIVIDADKGKLIDFVKSFGEGYYVSEQAAKEAFLNCSMFNIIDFASGYKADLIIKKKRAFSIGEFKRKKSVNILGEEVYIVSPEDSILSKLEWSKEGESERQFNDAVGVAAVQWDSLDIDYLKKCAEELEIKDLLNRLLEEAEKLQS